MPKPAKGNKNKTLILDTVMLLAMEIRIFPVGQEGIVATYASGYMDGANFRPVERYQFAREGADFQALASHIPNGTDNLWTEMENLIYAEIDKESGA